MRRLLKVKAGADGVTVVYERGTPEGPEKITVDSPEEPREDLGKALQELTPHLLALCELPGEWADDITVCGVTLKYEDGDTPSGCVITGLRALEDRPTPFVVNSPYTNELSVGLVAALLPVMGAAFAYIDGQRAQGQLALVTEDDEGAATS